MIKYFAKILTQLYLSSHCEKWWNLGLILSEFWARYFWLQCKLLKLGWILQFIDSLLYFLDEWEFGTMLTFGIYWISHGAHWNHSARQHISLNLSNSISHDITGDLRNNVSGNHIDPNLGAHFTHERALSSSIDAECEKTSYPSVSMV